MVSGRCKKCMQKHILSPSMRPPPLNGYRSIFPISPPNSISLGDRPGNYLSHSHSHSHYIPDSDTETDFLQTVMPFSACRPPYYAHTQSPSRSPSTHPSIHPYMHPYDVYTYLFPRGAIPERVTDHGTSKPDARGGGGGGRRRASNWKKRETQRTTQYKKQKHEQRQRI